MAEWIDDLARALGEPPLTAAEKTRLLETARDVAHRVERKFTPLTTFVIGTALGRRLADGADRIDALKELLEQVRDHLPPESDG
ncbi:putative molybdopterin-guanine dinucleotide biosynthesis protein MobA [Mycolicibacterium hassiacum DSM 44199]|jgi:hypothetical protein|uniref:Putative molybdopterin-guanine dinucleotide biosynthesis protein MobA n=1 Tax=Mycolicibacterium hassiacum (strain DSM 44199 / CIP 105218 / JCM 12690 / 3849) TaxID=1122247 RepID=K5B791_MYCHD|nr:DUF6457 domain-containing protein [Mycolicibacterium hassiacum]EKF21538.1 putative molybdopterin-guanine dinucleotide biosynthesis protein MobA [Mycolicibacterium hassiacum DSM 44199]MBX5488131.1 molybdopterin-guanine dinucleotide biosynthesis protein MobA [Mycolicibacterium hassiacum]MDA4088524.1 molybdopterin-guanine dinucleotide biosynthesis protein MobA [Mycolicibacterium hassiacum DSM 44199]PZN14171.1 MAG: molybdopterin-guanine dinucleotide biosynthesis protein MobA [Mycolicibacterium h